MSQPFHPFLLAREEFFESLEHYAVNTKDFYSDVRAILPPNWDCRRSDAWFSCGPTDVARPAQGWKLHVSATPANAKAVLTAVSNVLVELGVPFKFALDRRILARMNGRNWSRGGSGKFITVYPQDLDDFLSTSARLAAATQAYAGPYVLSDRRVPGSQAVYYRYGGFAKRRDLRLEGDFTPYVLAPDGTHVADIREPRFILPPWTSDPYPQEPDSDENEALRDGRYEIKGVLGFSNAGGVYAALDRHTDEEVIIKEARPHIVSGSEDYSAVESLQKEFRVLTRLAGTGVAPLPIELFQEWEHWFLVQERLPGQALSDYSARTNFVLLTEPTDADQASYLENYRRLFLRIVTIADVLHQHGVAYGDVSPHNVIVPDDLAEAKLIDFEGAVEVGIDERARIATPGFVAPEQRFGAPTAQSDCFALGTLGAAMLFPINALCELDPDARWRFLDAASEAVGLPASIRELLAGMMAVTPEARPSMKQVAATIAADSWQARPRRTESPDPERLTRIRDRALEFVRANLTVDRRDRLAPADGRVFSTNPLGVAYGACGIARGFLGAGTKVPPEVLDWIVRTPIDQATYPPGLYVGLAGIAWTLADCGVQDRSRDAIELAINHPLRHTGPDIWWGEAGIGMAALRCHLEWDEPRLLACAEESAEFLASTGIETAAGVSWPFRDATSLGFAHGASGIATFLLFLYRRTGEERWLTLGIRALEFDLSHAATTRDQGWSWPYTVETPSALLPYFQYGSAGVGSAVARYLRVTGEPKYRDALEHIRRDTARTFALTPGRAIGLAGLAEFLTDAFEATGEERFIRDRDRPLRGLELFASERPDGVVFAGDRLQRLSCDYASGNAGIAVTLHRSLCGGGGDLMLDAALLPPPVARAEEQFA